MLETVKAVTVSLALGAILGMGVEYQVMKPKPVPVNILPEKAVAQADGSVILATAPTEKPIPKQEVPKGYTVERVVEVKVQPRQTAPLPSVEVTATTTGSSQEGKGKSDLPPTMPNPVTVDLTLVKDKAGDERVIASSPDGAIMGSSIDIPATTGPSPKALCWGAGVSRSFDTVSGKGYTGGVVERDLGPFRAGLNINRAQITASFLVRF